jgi:hypothetical protein
MEWKVDSAQRFEDYCLIKFTKRCDRQSTYLYTVAMGKPEAVDFVFAVIVRLYKLHYHCASYHLRLELHVSALITSPNPASNGRSLA